MKHTGYLRQNEQNQFKSRIGWTCENYYQIKIPNQHEEITKKLSNIKEIIISIWGKRRGVVVLNHTSFTEKCCNILTSDQFKIFKGYTQRCQSQYHFMEQLKLTNLNKEKH